MQLASNPNLPRLWEPALSEHPHRGHGGHLARPAAEAPGPACQAGPPAESSRPPFLEGSGLREVRGDVRVSVAPSCFSSSHPCRLCLNKSHCFDSYSKCHLSVASNPTPTSFPTRVTLEQPSVEILEAGLLLPLPPAPTQPKGAKGKVQVAACSQLSRGPTGVWVGTSFPRNVVRSQMFPERIQAPALLASHRTWVL